jgi:hypothetical protein
MPPDVTIHGQETPATEKLHPWQSLGLNPPLVVISMDNFDVLGSDCVYGRQTDESIQLERMTVILMEAV